MATIDEDDYLALRVDDQLAHYEKAANRAKRSFVWLQSAIIILAVLVPVGVNLPTEWGGRDFSREFRLTVTALSVLLAVLSGLQSFRKYGELWLSFRATEEFLKQEKFLFLTKSGKYAPSDSPFNDFVVSVESIVSAEHAKFVHVIEQASRPTKEPDHQPPKNDADVA